MGAETNEAGEIISPINPKTNQPYSNSDRFYGNKTKSKKSLETLEKKYTAKIKKLDLNSKKGKAKYLIIKEQYDKEIKEKKAQINKIFTNGQGINYGNSESPF